MSIHKCNTCDYEKEVHSAGVHMSTDGSLKVYSEDDEFQCPNCSEDDPNQSKLGA